MPVIASVTRGNAPLREIKFEGPFSRLLSNWLDSSYFATDSAGQKYAYPGMIVAKDTDTGKYVPYSGTASYGTGSDTAVGVLDTFEDVTLEDVAIAPIFHGSIVERYCHAYGGDLGTVAAGVKTALTDIKWI